MSIKSRNLAENVPENLIRSAKLSAIRDQLFENFSAWEERNAEMVNKFFNQPYFRGWESLINKCAEIDSNIDFDYIKDEAISLSLLLDNKHLKNLQLKINNITLDNIELAIKQEIFDKIKSRISWDANYSDFDTECAISHSNDEAVGIKNESLTSYFKKVLNYLKRKELDPNWKKVGDIFRGLIISNEDLNKRLPSEEQIPTWIPLTDSRIPKFTKKAFDSLLSFEIGEMADCALGLANEISNKLQGLLYGNSLPVISTIVGEDDELKYDEDKLWDEYKWKLEPYQSEIQTYQWQIKTCEWEIETIKSNKTVSEDEKQRLLNEKWWQIKLLEQQIKNVERQIENLRWDYYLKYLKSKNSKFGNILQQLYDNNFDYSKINQSDLEDYLNKIADIRLKMFFESGTDEAIKAVFGNQEEYDKFEDFYKNLVNLSKDKIELLPGIELPVKKEIIGWSNRWLKDINGFWAKDKSYDTLPISYTIKKSDIDSLPISEDDKKSLHNFLTRVKTDWKEWIDENWEPTGKLEWWDNYIIEWKEISILLTIFFLVNAREFKTEASSENQEILEKTLNNEDDKDWWIENGDSLTPEQFKEKIEWFWPAKFENGSEIWLPMWNSELPGWWYQWMKIKLSKVNMKDGTFIGTISWWELKFSSNREWKSINFKMNQKFFDDLEAIVSETTADENKIWLLPNPDWLNFNSFRENLHGKLGTYDFSFPPESMWLIWDGDKFIKKDIGDWKDKVEVKYFWIPWDDKATYKVEYNPIRKSFTVSSSFNWNEKGKDWKPEMKRWAYKREMDWNNFLIFFTQKWLAPQTEEESKKAIQKQNINYKIANGWHWKLYWFSINNVKNGFKEIISSLKKWIEEYDKDKTKDFKEIVEGPILKALSRAPLPPSWKYAVWERQQELYNEEYNSAWVEIEKYLKQLQGDDQFADTFDQVPAHIQTIYWKSYRDFLKDLFDKKWEPSITEKRKAAALLLANIQKWDSPFRGLSDFENKWFWVKAILWEAHYNLFMSDRKKCLDKIKQAWDDKEQYQAWFATCEMDYIINNVCGSDGKIEFFGSHEERKINWDESTNYVPNPSKRILSEKFANELRNSRKWFDKSAIETAYGKASTRTFDQARADFERFLKSSRHPKWIGNFMRMIDAAKTESQLYELRKCFLIYVLSGLLDVYGDKEMREQVYVRWKTMMFLPGMLTYNTWHSEQAVELLNDFCKENWYQKFSDKIKSYFHSNDLKDWWLNISQLIKDVNTRWTPEIDKKFDDYSRHKFKYKSFPEGSNMANLQKSIDNPKTKDVYHPMLKNSLIANSGWLSSSVDVVEDRAQFRDGKFTWNEVKEQEERAKFWTGVSYELNNKLKSDNPDDLDFALSQFLKRFELNSDSDKQEIFTWVKTADWRKWKKWEHSYYTEKDKDGKTEKGATIDMWVVGEDEIDSILRYTFKWKALYDRFNSTKLPKELNKTLDDFYKFFKEAFYKGTFNYSSIIKKTFGIANEQDFPELEIWSWELYSQVIDHNNNLRRDNDQTKNDIWRNFLSSKFINSKIAQMETTFRNRWLTQYLPIREGQKDYSKHVMGQL